MGYQVNGQCVATQQAAASVQCASYPMQSVSADGVSSVACVGIAAGGTSLQLQRTSTSGASPVSMSLAVAYPECDATEQYTDLFQLWGLGLVALVTLWSLRTFVLRLVTPQ